MKRFISESYKNAQKEKRKRSERFKMILVMKKDNHLKDKSINHSSLPSSTKDDLKSDIIQRVTHQ